MKNLPGGEILIIIVALFIFFDSEEITVSKQPVEVAKKITTPEPKHKPLENYEKFISADGKSRIVRDGDTHLIKYEIRIPRGGYVGNGQAEEIIKGQEIYTYSGDYVNVGWNGLPRNCGLDHFKFEIKSVFDAASGWCIIPTYLAEHIASIKLSGVEIMCHAEVDWGDEKVVYIKIRPTTKDEIQCS